MHFQLPSQMITEGLSSLRMAEGPGNFSDALPCLNWTTGPSLDQALCVCVLPLLP